MALGIPKLDQKLNLPESANILVIGPPGEEKVVFGMQFVGDGLLKKAQCVYITTDMAPVEVENKAAQYGWRYFSYTNRQLYFVDCYSWTLGGGSAGAAGKAKRADVGVPGPSALNDLSIGITQAVQQAFKEPQNNKVVFHSLSTLLLYNNPEIVFRFVQITGARLKSAGASTVWLLESGMHEDKAVTTLKHLMDGTIEMKRDGQRLLLTAPQNGVGEWLEFRLGKAGVEL